MKKFTKFVLKMGKVGCLGFGGGSALIPVIEEEIIRGQQLDTGKNYDKDVTVASITPGALPVEIASSLGNRNFGIKGMIFGALAIAAPGAIATVLLLSFLVNAQEQVLSVVDIASIGISGFIIYLLSLYIGNVVKKAYHSSIRDVWVTIAVIALSFFLSCGKNL